jgi:hypothetical protein
MPFTLFDVGACNCTPFVRCCQSCVPTTDLSVSWASSGIPGTGSLPLTYNGSSSWYSACFQWSGSPYWWRWSVGCTGSNVEVSLAYADTSAHCASFSFLSGSDTPDTYTYNPSPFSMGWAGVSLAGLTFSTLGISSPGSTGCYPLYYCGSPCASPQGIPATNLSLSTSGTLFGTNVYPLTYNGSGNWTSPCITTSGGSHWQIVLACVSGAMQMTWNQYAGAGCTGGITFTCTRPVGSSDCCNFFLVFQTTVITCTNIGAANFTVTP